MKLGVILDHHLPSKGGAERAVSALVQGALKAHHEVVVYCLSAAQDAPGRAVLVDVPALPRGRRERAFADAALARARADGVDVTLGIRHLTEVDVYWPHGGLHRATLAAGERAKGGVTGSVSALLHRVSPRHRAFLQMEDALLASGGARTIWCVSEAVRAELAHGHPDCASRLETHPNGVDLKRFHPDLRAAQRCKIRAALNVPEGTPLLVFFGGNWRLKGFAVLCAALATLSDMDWTCLLMGRGADRALATARRAGLAGRWRSRAAGDVRPILGAADLLVQPTFRDPCSLATLEALASGVPVLTTPANGAADALVTPQAGAVVPVGDAQAWTAALRDWLPRLGDPVARTAHANAARAAVAERGRRAWIEGLLRSLEAARE